MIVHWTETAIKHLTGIYQYIALDSPLYAQRVADKIIRPSAANWIGWTRCSLAARNWCSSRRRPTRPWSCSTSAPSPNGPTPAVRLSVGVATSEADIDRAAAGLIAAWQELTR